MQDSYQDVWVGDNVGTADSSGIILDSDRFNNNLFTLENIQVVTNSSDLPDPLRWGAASYRRDTVKSGTLQDADGTVYSNTRLLDPGKDFGHLPTRKYLKFSLFMQGGFDGLNIFDKEKSEMSDTASRREMTDDSAQGGKEGPTIAAYRKAIDVMEEKSDVDIQLLAVPGQRHEAITDYAIDSVEARFDALFIMDIEEKDNIGSFITGSTQIPNVSNTVTRFEARNLDSSFAAAYYPDVVMVDPVTNTNIVCPPSVAVLGAFSRNDAVAHPWYAPAGFSRGSLNVIESQVKLNRANLDALYEADINPITSFPQSSGVIVFGQKTLLAAQSSLDRVNVRRLLIDIRRKVRKVANTILFEPNRAATLARFSAAVTPILTRIQQQQGLDRFKVQIDTSTTTQADVENNTVRGKIFLQPTRAVEFIALDFVVTNQGANI
jgi:phage tail sheath protein FI